MLMPAGARDDRRWRLTDADEAINAKSAASGGLDLAIDFEHQTQLAGTERADGAGRRLAPRAAGAGRCTVGTCRVDRAGRLESRNLG